MRLYIASAVVAAAGMCGVTAASMAQTATPPQHVPLQKTIGQAARAEVVPFAVRPEFARRDFCRAASSP